MPAKGTERNRSRIGRDPRVLLPILAVAFALGAATVPLVRASAAGTPEFAVILTASPSAGSTPLDVAFAANVTQGTPTTYDWSFGDSSFLNGSASRQVVHEYPAVGQFNATVVVHEGASASSAFRLVRVTAGPLALTIGAQQPPIAAPVTVAFTAHVAGGTGTYPWVNWSFGDGGVGQGLAVNYTFVRAGNFSVSVTVTDSSGHRSTAIRGTVVPGVVPDTSAQGNSGWPYTVPVLAVGGGVAGALAYFGLIRARRGRDPTDSIPAEHGSSEYWPEGGPGPSLLAPQTDASTPDPTDGPRPGAPGPFAVIAPSGKAEPGTSAAGPRSWSREIVLHLGRLGRLGPDDIPTTQWSQRGMAEALGIRQNQVSNVLRRLAAAGLVSVELRHVQGEPRRLRVYGLTSRGEALFRHLRATRSVPGVPVQVGTRRP